MKLAVLAAFVALINAQAQATGTACEKASDACGDDTKMCCGIFSGGKMCTDDTCKDITSTNSVPNIVACNDKTTAEEWIQPQKNADGKSTIYWHYAADGFKCLATKTEEVMVIQ